MKTNFKIFLTVTLAVLLTACGSSRSGSFSGSKLDANSFSDLSSGAAVTSYNPAPRLESEVAPGYLIEIITNQDATLNGEYRISEQGILDLPYNVKVTSSNTSLAELRSMIRDNYRSYFRGTPDIEIKIVERKVWVRAQGLVNKPGTYLLEPKAGLDEVIALAGGLKSSSNDGVSTPRFAKISGEGSDAVIRLTDFFGGNSSLVSGWRGGESVFFQSDIKLGVGQSAFDAKYVHVLGQVRAPGEYAFKDQANFFYYLVQAGGPTDRANTEKILVIRSDAKGMKTVKVSMEEINDAPILKGGDVLFVQADNASDLERNSGILGNLGGFFGSIATAVLVGNEL